MHLESSRTVRGKLGVLRAFGVICHGHRVLVPSKRLGTPDPDREQGGTLPCTQGVRVAMYYSPTWPPSAAALERPAPAPASSSYLPR